MSDTAPIEPNVGQASKATDEIAVVREEFGSIVESLKTRLDVHSTTIEATADVAGQCQSDIESIRNGLGNLALAVSELQDDKSPGTPVIPPESGEGITLNTIAYDLAGVLGRMELLGPDVLGDKRVNSARDRIAGATETLRDVINEHAEDDS